MSVVTLRNGAFINPVPSPYSKDQVVQWLDAIGFWKARDGNFSALRGISDSTEMSRVSRKDLEAIDLPPPTLENLVVVTRLHLLAFPFESTTIHYSAHHDMDISPEGLYRRLVVERNGSYCYGLNGLMFGMLLGIGYRAYAGQARTNTTPNGRDMPQYIQMSHMVIFVQPLSDDSNITYLVDVGFGGGGLTRPILLDDHEDNVVVGTGPTEKHRLRRGPIAMGSFGDTYWHLEVLHQKPNPSETCWRIVYSFQETEYFQNDFEALSYFVSTHPTRGSPFSTQTVFLKKYFWVDGGEDIGDLSKSTLQDTILQKELGTLTLNGRILKRQIGKQVEVIKEFKTEKERVRAIKQFFDVDVPENGIAYIRGRVSALE